MDSLSKYLRWLINTGLYLILLTPLLVWPGFLFPHLTAKVLLFQVLVEIVTASTLAFCLLRRRADLKGGKTSAIPERSPLLLSLSLFLGYSLISAAFGIDVRRSLWGFMERQDGLVLWLHFFAWFVVLGWAFQPSRPLAQPEISLNPPKSKSRPRKRKQAELHSYLEFSYWVSVATALSALVEWVSARLFGYAPELIRSVEPARVSGVFGLPTALGPYLLFHFFYGFYSLASLRGHDGVKRLKSEAKGKPAKASSEGMSFTPALMFFLVGETILVGAIILGQTRGVILGLVFSLLLMDAVVVLQRSAPRSLRIAAGVGLGLLLLGSLLLWQFRESETVKEIPILDRLTHLSVSESESSFMRSLTWRSAARGFWDHPLSGWGHDNVYYALNKHYDPRHVHIDLDFLESKATWYDKSHNAYLDLLVEKGILGGILFLSVILLLARELWKMEDRRLALCIACGFISYGISNAVAFDSFGSLFGAFLFLACVNSANLSKDLSGTLHEVRKQSPIRKAGQRVAGWLRRASGPVLLMIGLILCVGLYANIEIAAANSRYLDAQRGFAQEPALGIRLYERAFAKSSPYAPKEKLNCAYLIVSSLVTGRPLPDASANTEFALQLAREAISYHPQDAAFHMILNDLYNSLALYRDKKYIMDAEFSGKRALELSPKRQEARFYLGRTYIIKGETRKAVDLNREMVEQYPSFPLAHWFFGLSLLADNQNDRAKEEIKRAIEMGYKFQSSREADTVKELFGAQAFDELMKNK